MTLPSPPGLFQCFLKLQNAQTSFVCVLCNSQMKACRHQAAGSYSGLLAAAPSTAARSPPPQPRPSGEAVTTPPSLQERALSSNIRHIRDTTLQLSTGSRVRLAQGLLEPGNQSGLMLYLEPILFCSLILDRLFKIGALISP